MHARVTRSSTSSSGRGGKGAAYAQADDAIKALVEKSGIPFLPVITSYSIHYTKLYDVVCIFPEGRITDTGELYPFRPGVSRIVADTPVPVVPMALRGLWGSFFSRRAGAAMSWRSWLRPFSKIGLTVGEPVSYNFV